MKSSTITRTSKAWKRDMKRYKIEMEVYLSSKLKRRRSDASNADGERR
jgi:hypothetical protein